MDLATRRVTAVAGPDYVEKNHIRVGPRRRMFWGYRDPQNVERLAEKTDDGVVRDVRGASNGARWPSTSRDGSRLVYTVVQQRVEYWLAENVHGVGSPLTAATGPEAVRSALASREARAQTLEHAPTGAAFETRDRRSSPSDLFRR